MRRLIADDTPAAEVELSGESIKPVISLDETLVAFGNELLYLFEGEGFLAARFAPETVEPDVIEGALHGEPYDPERHPVKVLVKGITWHQLHAGPRQDGSWTARVIFDI